jgi:sulfur-oxidizing protein SoxA
MNRPSIRRCHPDLAAVIVASLALVPVALAPLALAPLALAQVGGDARRTGYQDMSETLQKMEDDDSANPGMLFVQAGELLWRQKPQGREGAAGKACADCHAEGSMKGVAARYPSFPPNSDSPVDLEGRINLCRTQRQQAEPLKLESDDLLALTAWLAQQSRGEPIAPPEGPRLKQLRGEGEAIFRKRQGQINLSCASCHDDNAGKKLAGATIPQAHPTAYPVYRLEWQTLGSLKRRLRNCLVGLRAEPYDYDSREYIALEAWLMERARGLKLEGVGVRP